MCSLEEKTGVTSVPNYIDSLSFNENGELALVASNLTGRTWDGLLAVFDSPQLAPNIPHIEYAALNEAGCTDVMWIDTKRVVVATDAGTVEVWELKEAPNIENVILLCEHNDICSSISVCEHSKQILSGSWDKTIKLWDLEVDLPIHDIRIHADKVLDVLWNRFTSDIFASASEDSSVKVYDNRVDSKPVNVLATTLPDFPLCLDWINEHQICIGLSNGDVLISDRRNPRKVTAQNKIHNKSVNVVLSHGDYVASASDDCSVKISTVTELKGVSSDEKHSDYVTGLAFNRKDSTLWSTAWDGSVLKHELLE